MLVASKSGVAFDVPIRVVEQPHAELEAQHAAHSVVDSAHRHLALLNKLLEIGAEREFVRHHRHVDAGVDGNLYSVLFVGCDMVAGAQVVDVSPVGNNHAVPVEVLFEPTGEQFAIGMERHAVVHARVHHQRECAGAHSFEERGEIFFAHVDVRHRRRGAVLAAHGHAVSHIVLSARGYVELVDVVRVVALKTFHSLDSHLSIYVAVLAEALPHA